MTHQFERDLGKAIGGVSLGLALVLTMTGCAKKSGNSSDNPSVETTPVTVKSGAYGAAGLLAANPVSEFKFCVTKVEIESGTAMSLREAETGSESESESHTGTETESGDDNGTDPAGSDDNGMDSWSIERGLGLVDVSNSGAASTWGQLDVPVDFSLRELKVEVHRDPEVCEGADYSVLYEGTRLTSDLEFKFEFSPAVSLKAGDTITVGLDSIAAALASAAAAGKLDDDSVGEYLTTETKGEAEVESGG